MLDYIYIFIYHMTSNPVTFLFWVQQIVYILSYYKRGDALNAIAYLCI